MTTFNPTIYPVIKFLSPDSYKSYAIGYRNNRSSSYIQKAVNLTAAKCYSIPILCSITYIVEKAFTYLRNLTVLIGLTGFKTELDLSNPPSHVQTHQLHISHQKLQEKWRPLYYSSRTTPEFTNQFNDFMEEAYQEMQLWFSSLATIGHSDVQKMASIAEEQSTEPGEANYCYCFFNSSFVTIYRWLRDNNIFDPSLYSQGGTPQYLWNKRFNEFAEEINKMPIRDERFRNLFDLSTIAGAPTFGKDPLKLDSKHEIFNWDSHLKKIKSIMGETRFHQFNIKELTEHQSSEIYDFFMWPNRAKNAYKHLTKEQIKILTENKQTLSQNWQEGNLVEQFSCFQDPQRLKVQKTMSNLLVDQWYRVLYLLKSHGSIPQPKSLDEFKLIISKLDDTEDKNQLLSIVANVGHPTDIAMCRALELWIEDKNLMKIFPRVCHTLSHQEALEELNNYESFNDKANFIRHNLSEWIRTENDQDLSLDLSGLELTDVPQTILKFKSLKTLNIKNNHLNTLPEKLRFTDLTELDLSYNDLNRIKKYQIPISLTTLKLQGNSWSLKVTKKARHLT